MDISFVIDRRSHQDRRRTVEDRAQLLSPRSEREQRKNDRRNPASSATVFPVENEEELVREVAKLPNLAEAEVFASFDEHAQLSRIYINRLKTPDQTHLGE